MKSNFKRSLNKLSNLLDRDDLPSRKDVRQARHNMDTCHAIAIGVLTNFADFYTKNNEVHKGKLVVREMDKIEEDFYLTSESAREYLESRKGDNSSVYSDILSINLLGNMNIFDQSETYCKKDSAPIQQQRSSKVNSFRRCGKSDETVSDFPTPTNSPVALRSLSECTAQHHNMHIESDPILNGNRHDANTQHLTESHTNHVSHTIDKSSLNVPFGSPSAAQFYRSRRMVTIEVSPDTSDFGGEKTVPKYERCFPGLYRQCAGERRI